MSVQSKSSKSFADVLKEVQKANIAKKQVITKKIIINGIKYN